MRPMRKLIASAASFLLALGLLLTVIDLCCFDRGFYKREYEAHKTAESLRMSEEDLFLATETLLDYLQNKRDDIRVTATVNGMSREVYNERETRHMADVKVLYQRAMLLRTVSVFLGLLGLGFVLKKSTERFVVLKEGIFIGEGLFLTLIACIAIASLVDFDAFWIFFHEQLFTNDLWLLDPGTSIMINMFPDYFFFHLVMRIVACFIGIHALIFGLFAILKRKRKRL